MKATEETIRYTQRIEDTSAEAIAHYNLGHAYKNLPGIRDLDAAEAAYHRALKLFAPEDKVNQSGALNQIGIVHHERFREARRQVAPAETQLKHAQAAEQHYQRALDLCPASAITAIGMMHNVMGALYQDVGETERARQHYEKAAQYHEQSGDNYGAGHVRKNMAHMYANAPGQEETPGRQRDLLRRAQAYAQAALRDYHRYEGRAADEEAQTQQLLDQIAQALAKLSQ